MALSHFFASEHIENRGGEKADADRDHRDIKHDGLPQQGSRRPWKLFSAPVTVGAGEQH
jgi:hypothetical protein